ncbi:MAG: (2Fe-2S)-binding protein [Steroidobacterales bacterium]
MSEVIAIRVTINRREVSVEVAPQTLLVELIREHLGLHGTRQGCDTAQCGACTVLMDGSPVKSCNLLAVQADSKALLTVEGLAGEDGSLHPLQRAFNECHALQCGFCTSGMLMSLLPLTAAGTLPDEQQLRELLDGNLCRCTGYAGIVKAAQQTLSNARRSGPMRAGVGETA